MKEYRKISFLAAFSFISVITFGQATAINYLYKAAPFNIDTIFKPVSLYNNIPPTHISFNTLNDQFTDTSHVQVNPMAVPAFHQIKKHSLLAGSQTVQKQMNAGSYYQPYFFQTIQYGPTTTPSYNPIDKPYQALPYGYSPFSNKTTESPYYILPKY